MERSADGYSFEDYAEGDGSSLNGVVVEDIVLMIEDCVGAVVVVGSDEVNVQAELMHL